MWHILESDFELMLVNARDVKQVPGRKTDVSDSVWLCRLAEAGLLRASFVPPKPIRDLRLLTRYRRTQIAERKREAQRLHKALEDKASSWIASRPTSWASPAARCSTRSSRARPTPSCSPSWPGASCARRSPPCAILAHLDFLDEQIEQLSAAIQEQMHPFEKAVELLCTIPGVGQRTAEVIIAEIGTDMTVFPSAGHLASWAGQCPGNDQSAGKRRSGRTRKGSKSLNFALKDAAMAALRTNDSYLQALYRRKKPQLGHGRALGAVKHSIICACWHMLSTGELYNDLGGDYYTRRNPERQTKRLIAQLERLGHTVTLQDKAA
ncbi:MAG: IS110 family transposase [Thermoleophilaceae bacterium]